MTDRLSQTFAALADPTRRAILSRLIQGEATLSELSAPFEMTVPAVAKHIKILEQVGLVTRGQRAQAKPIRLQATGLREPAAWLDRHYQLWSASLDRLDALVARKGRKKR